MKSDEEFCPLLKGPCDKNCVWFHRFVEIDETGMDQDDYCAINVIVERLLEEEPL